MKTSIKKLTYFLLLLTLASCTKDGAGLLDKAESGDLNEERVFTNAKYTKEFLTDIYRRIPYSWDNNVYLDACTDDGESRPWWGWVNNVHVGAYNPTSMPDKFKRWADYYAAIRACNLFLSKIDNVPVDPEQYMNSIEVRDRLKYEAVLLRAYFYAELVRWYGSVPLITKVLQRDSPELLSGRASLAEMQKFISDECDRAAANLPARQTGGDYMRVTSGLAKAVKARVMLHLASPLFNSNASGSESPWSWGGYDANRWLAAAEAAKAVIDHTDENGAPVYSLVVRTEPNNYFGTRVTYPGSMKAMGWFNVFITRVNTEYILGYARKGLTNELDKWQLPGAMQRAGDASFTLPTYNYAACFETKEGYPVYQTDEYGVPRLDGNGQFLVNPESGFDPQQPYANRDSRFYHSLWYNGSMFSGITFNPWRGEDGSFGQEFLNGYAHTGLFLRKFMDPKNITINNSGVQGQTNHSFPVYRFVEMLLNYAEAMNEYLPDGADRSEAIAALDKIRARADMPSVAITFANNGWNTSSQAQLRKFIRNERRIELAFEDHRFFDIRRWNIGEQTQKTVYEHDILKKADGSFVYKILVWERRVFQQKHNLLPIPQSEVNNNPNMQQNPGW